MIKFLPSYVGSKAYWVNDLSRFEGQPFVELFSGSAVLSANLASSSVLNDLDPYVYKIFSNYDKLIVPDKFTSEDYFKVRGQDNWWQYVYCLLSMSFSGVFRYSKNGFNVPVKKTIDYVSKRTSYEESKKRFIELNPTVLSSSYIDVDMDLLEDKIVVLDPPYENSQASYNSAFDYHIYWEYVANLEGFARKIILFDDSRNIPFLNYKSRKMRVNGGRPGGIESMFIFEESLKRGQEGERIFLEKSDGFVKKLDGLHGDFITEDGKKLELKTDYYDMDKTENFFIERYSDRDRKTPGGPWQALKHGCFWYAYYFVKNDVVFLFETAVLVKELEALKLTERDLVNIPNRNYVTQGYKIKRSLVNSPDSENGSK